MTQLRHFLLIFLFTFCTSSFAQDGLLNLDDLANEQAKIEAQVKKEKAKAEADAKAALKAEELALKKKAEAEAEKLKKIAQENSQNQKPEQTKTEAPVVEKESSPITAIIAGLIVAIIATLVLLKVKAGKKDQVIRPKGTSALEKETEEPKEKAKPVQLPPQTLPTSNQSESSQAGSPEYIKENTALDPKGRNPSGIVIDEDKYFDGDSNEFVDEDFIK